MSKAARVLKEAYDHHGHDIQDIVLRGEYLYTANGPGGFEVFDVANIDQKGFSERIVSAPVSPLGQRTRIRHQIRHERRPAEHARARSGARRACRRTKSSRSISFYAFVYVTDREEGLVVVECRDAR